MAPVLSFDYQLNVHCVRISRRLAKGLCFAVLAAVVVGRFQLQQTNSQGCQMYFDPIMFKDFSHSLPRVEITTFRSGGKGGQHQNKTESGVRVRHCPSGIVVVCRDERSQYLNKMRALATLRERLKKRAEKPKPRIATRVSESQKVRRREAKKQVAAKKQMRRKPAHNEV
jgi:protein subunit release factor B